MRGFLIGKASEILKFMNIKLMKIQLRVKLYKNYTKFDTSKSTYENTFELSKLNSLFWNNNESYNCSRGDKGT